MDERTLEKVMESPILITGCARSGTSMTAGVISFGGVVGGDMFGPNRYNKRGMFENKIIREGITKPYLRTINADPMGQYPLPAIETVYHSASDSSFVRKWRETVQCAITSQLENPNTRWFYKGAKMCLMWPLWAAAFPEAQWVLVRRSDSELVRSCMKTSFMKAFKTKEGWTSWVDEHKKRFSEMKQAGLNLIEVWPEKVIYGNLSEYKEMMTWLGLPFDEDKTKEFIDPHLWNRGANANVS